MSQITLIFRNDNVDICTSRNGCMYFDSITSYKFKSLHMAEFRDDEPSLNRAMAGGIQTYMESICKRHGSP